MLIISKVMAYIGTLAVSIISYLGYFGVFILMALESMIAPVPSELVMPFAGFLAAEGRFSFWLIIVFSSLGTIFGSLLSYYIGMYGGNRVVLKYGKYLLLDATDLEKTEKWFERRGEKTIFISRFIPVVRHLISIPAGIGKMNVGKFCVYTIAGATIWNSFLAYLGFVLGENWESVKHYSEYISITAAILLVIGFAYFIYHHIKNKRKNLKIEKEMTR